MALGWFPVIARVYIVSMFRLAFLSFTACLLMASPALASKQGYYVSLGDSYAAGYQPKLGNTKQGFVYQLPGYAKKKGYKLKVVNFGCGGATTVSLINRKGCPRQALGPGAKRYSKTQLQAATDFITKNRSKVRLITVSIGGNDVTSCVNQADPISCVGAATQTLDSNVSQIATALREAAGPEPILLGTTYPDVVLGAWVNPGTEASRSLASLSVFAFQSLINPTLEKAYAKGAGGFVDVTSATGAYGSMEVFEDFAPYGSIPKPVADVCRVSWYCSKRDIHANKRGYALIARLVAAKLP